MSSGEKPRESNDKKPLPRKKTLDDQRRPATSIPPTEDEFKIVSPDPHEPEGQTTHE